MSSDLPVERIALNDIRADLTDAVARALSRRVRVILTRYRKDIIELTPLADVPLEPSARELFPQFFVR